MTRRSVQLSVALVAWFAAALGTVALPAPALANLYTITPCAVGRAPYAGAQMLSSDGNTSIDNQCATGGGYRMTFYSPNNQSVDGLGNGFRFRVPDAFPHAHIIGVSGNITIALRNGSPTGFFTIDETNGGYDNGTAAGGPQQTWPQGVTPQFGPADFTQTPLSPTRSVIWRISPTGVAQGSTTDFDATALGANYILNGLSATMDDSVSPLAATIAKTGLLDGTTQSGTRTLTLDTRDEDSGVATVSVRSGTTEVGTLTTGGACTFASVEACPSERAGDIAIDTTKLPDGAQTLAVVTQDAAGNQQTTYTPVFTVANAGMPTPRATPLPLNGDPKGTPVISNATTTSFATAKTQETKPTKQSTAWHHPVTLAGRVFAADGTPMAGADLTITETVAVKGSTTTTLGTVTTDAAGRYRYTFKATSSATIVVAYPQHVGGSDYLTTRALSLAVRAHVSLKRSGSPNRGMAMRFTGHVDAAPLPPGGARVAIQYHSKSGAWLNATEIATDTRGNFHWTHDFAKAGSYRLRAHVLADRQLGAAPGTSTEVRFTIR